MHVKTCQKMLEREQEQDEWLACIVDDVSQADGHSLFAHRPSSFVARCSASRKIVPANRVPTVMMMTMLPLGLGSCMSLRRWARSGTSCDQEAHSSGAFFGSAKARSIEPAPGYDTGARADLRRNDQGRPLDWAASSTFDARYLTSVDPL